MPEIGTEELRDLLATLFPRGRLVECEPLGSEERGAGVARKGTGYGRPIKITLQEKDDPGVLETAAPFLAWRALVLACPRFYPDPAPEGRSALLTLAETALEATSFNPTTADALFA